MLGQPPPTDSIKLCYSIPRITHNFPPQNTPKKQENKHLIPTIPETESAWNKGVGLDPRRLLQAGLKAKAATTNASYSFPQEEGPGASPSIQRGIPIGVNENLELKWIGPPRTLPVGLRNGATALENNLTVSQSVKHRNTIWASNSLKRIPKRNRNTCPHKTYTWIFILALFIKVETVPQRFYIYIHIYIYMISIIVLSNMYIFNKYFCLLTCIWWYCNIM